MKIKLDSIYTCEDNGKVKHTESPYIYEICRLEVNYEVLLQNVPMLGQIAYCCTLFGPGGTVICDKIILNRHMWGRIQRHLQYPSERTQNLVLHISQAFIIIEDYSEQSTIEHMESYIRDFFQNKRYRRHRADRF